MKNNIVLFSILFILRQSVGLEYNKQQRYNTNSDFLLHEAGQNPVPPAPKRDYVASQPDRSSMVGSSGKQNYISQFPPLGVSSSTTSKPYFSNPGNTPNLQSTGKRDYVAPQIQSQKPNDATGKVRDLVNFYDGKNKEQNVPQNAPSYSSILKGSNGNNMPSSVPTTVGSTRYPQSVTQSTPKVSSPPTMKPLSFSAVVAGPNKPGVQPTLTVTTSKPSTRPSTPTRPTAPVISSTMPRPGTPVLPSEILNNNRNNNQGSSSGPSDVELQTVSEELLRKDVNNAAKYITINYQEKTTSQSTEDKAPRPLLTIAADAWNIPTVQKFVPLLDNYERDTLVNEYVTPQERNEENAFMDEIMSTSVIRHLMNFLKEKGYVTPDPRQQRDFLKQLWFSLYSRGKGKISSSGFEHVFVSEIKNGGVLGLHNWIYFSKEELANRVNYLGYLKYLELNNKGVVLKLHFNQQGADKPVDSMFIGTSPELEIALYTLCFVTRADNDCKLKLGNKDVDIVTHTFRYRSKNLIGSAYPQI